MSEEKASLWAALGPLTKDEMEAKKEALRFIEKWGNVENYYLDRIAKLELVLRIAEEYREEVKNRSGISFGKSKYCHLSIALEEAIAAAKSDGKE